MNSDFNSIVNALECSYQGNSEQIMQAQQFLLNMISQPNEYSEILINIMTNEETTSMTRVAAAIQFKYLLSNSEIFNFFTIDIMINIINSTIPLVHVQLQSILARIIERYLNENTEQGIQVLLSIIETCFNSDAKHIFIGIEIIRFIFKLNDCRLIPGIDYKTNLAVKYIVPLFNSLLNSNFDSFYPFLFHCMFLTANLLLNYSDLQPLNNWIEIIVNVLNQETESSSGIDKDAAKFATGIIELKQKIFEPRLATIIFNSIVNRIKRNQMSYKGILYSLRYIYRFLNFNSFVEDLLNQNQTNLILDFVSEILFEIFVLNSNSIRQINEDLFNFLLFRHNVNSDQMFDTPISGSIFILKKICEKKYFVNEIAQFSLLKISQNLDNDNNEESIYGKLYGSIHFASILAPYFDSSYSEIIIQSLTSSIQKNQENQQSSFFRMTLLFLFLSKKGVESLDLFMLALTNLTNESFPVILHYFCAISIPNFFQFFKIESIQSEIESNLNIPVFIKKLLDLNSNYPTNQITIAIKSIFEYFLMFLEPVSIDVISELFSIYCQFATEENKNKNKIISSINKLSNMMKNKEKSIEFYSISIEINMKIITEIDSDYYEDLLGVMNNLIHDAIEGIDQININSLNNLFIQIPEFLFELINNSSDSIIYPLITDILKVLAIHSINPSSSISINYISQPISKILHTILGKYSNQNNSELDDMPLLIPSINSINKLSQILFLVLKDVENIQPFLDLFTQLNQSCFADSIAAIGTLSPFLTFSNELNFRICMNSASPAAFLLCFEFITTHLNEMPKFVIEDQNKIEKVIQLNLENLLQEISQIEQNENNKVANVIDEDHDDESDDELIFFDDSENDILLNNNDVTDDSYIFNFQEILTFYQS